MSLNAVDKAVVRALQGDFPLVAEPYRLLAESVGLTEEEFLARVKTMAAEKKIRAYVADFFREIFSLMKNFSAFIPRIFFQENFSLMKNFSAFVPRSFFFGKIFR